MMSTTTTFAFVVIVIATTAATFAGHHIERTLNFFVCSFACSHHNTGIMQFLARKRMIQIEYHNLFFDFEHKTIEAEAFFIDKRKHCTRIDGVVVEATIHHKSLFGNFNHVLFLVRTISILHLQSEFKSVAFIEMRHFTFKRFECHTQTRNKLERMLHWCFFYQFTDTSFIVGKEFVGNSDVAVRNLGSSVFKRRDKVRCCCHNGYFNRIMVAKEWGNNPKTKGSAMH